MTTPRTLTGAHGRAVYDEELDRVRCTANSKQSGERCRNRPTPGAVTCRFHGSAAPQVRASARRRLMAAVDPAVDALVEIVEGETAQWRCLEPPSEKRSGVWKRVGYTQEVKRAAAEAILDRTGYPRRTELSHADGIAEISELLDELLGPPADA